jgi:hypothetical protein
MTPWYLSTKGVLEAAIGSSSFNCSVIVSHNIPSYFIEIHATVPPPLAAGRLSLLLATIHGSKGSMASGGLGVLTTHTNAPVVTETPVKAHPLHALNVLRQSAIVIDSDR